MLKQNVPFSDYQKLRPDLFQRHHSMALLWRANDYGSNFHNPLSKQRLSWRGHMAIVYYVWQLIVFVLLLVRFIAARKFRQRGELGPVDQ